jgi:uncharacterized membrane protein YbhN (UPF0104 family)
MTGRCEPGGDPSWSGRIALLIEDILVSRQPVAPVGGLMTHRGRLGRAQPALSVGEEDHPQGQVAPGLTSPSVRQMLDVLTPATPDCALPAFSSRALLRRAALPAALVAAAAIALILAGAPVRPFTEAAGRVLAADARWLVVVAVLETLSFAGYIALLWLVGSRATPRMNLVASAEVTLGGAAATRLLPTGGAGGAALTLWALRRTGTPRAGRTLLTFLVLLYAVFLAAIALAGSALALGVVAGHAPLALTAVPAAAALVAIAIALVLARSGHALGAAVRDALRFLRSGDARLLGAVAWWAFDAAVLWAMLHALGAPPAPAVVALAYLVGQVANTLPLPGAVSGGMVGLLLAFGVEADLAVAAVLAYRAVAIWLPAPLGLLALARLRGTTGRWRAEDAAVAGTPSSHRRRERGGLASEHDRRRPAAVRVRELVRP